jgi:hypothetical protein
MLRREEQAASARGGGTRDKEQRRMNGGLLAFPPPGTILARAGRMDLDSARTVNMAYVCPGTMRSNSSSARLRRAQREQERIKSARWVGTTRTTRRHTGSTAAGRRLASAEPPRSMSLGEDGD